MKWGTLLHPNRFLLILNKSDQINVFPLLLYLAAWRGATRFLRWRIEGRATTSGRRRRISSSPDCTDREAAGAPVRRRSCQTFLIQTQRLLRFFWIFWHESSDGCFQFLFGKTSISASYTLWQKSAKTMICLNLSFATETSRLVSPRRPSGRPAGDTAGTSSAFRLTSRLSGSRFVFLLPDNEMLSLQNKTRADKSAAVQFVKKDWGAFKNTINEPQTML